MNDQLMQATTTEGGISARARAIANGLVRTSRAAKDIGTEHGLLRLLGSSGGFYWISLDGKRVLKGHALFEADELQPKFIDAMERAGRQSR